LGDTRLQSEKDGRSGNNDTLVPRLHDRSQRTLQIVDIFDALYLKLNAERSCCIASGAGDATCCRIASALLSRITPDAVHTDKHRPAPTDVLCFSNAQLTQA
jgi:hypothetical protein